MTGYPTFSALKRHEKEGRDYAILHRHGSSGIAIMAPHGGGIEPGTGAIADALAGAVHAFYCFQGLKTSGNRRLHITSRNFDEPRAERILQASDWALTLHGCRERTPVIWVGGRDAARGMAFLTALQQARWPARPGERPGLHGVHPENLCNRGRSGAGVQLEISLGVRRMLFRNLEKQGAAQPTPPFHDLVHALSRGIQASVSTPSSRLD